MAIDFAKMKQKLQALQGNGGNSKQNVFWKPQDGDQSIRIVPTADGDPFKEFHFHYNVGKNAGFISPLWFFQSSLSVVEIILVFSNCLKIGAFLTWSLEILSASLGSLIMTKLSIVNSSFQLLNNGKQILAEGLSNLVNILVINT